MLQILSLVIATAFLVALRAFQNQNVIHGNYKLAAVTSYGIAIGEITLIINVINIGWASVFWVGTGGVIGVCTAMYLHRRFVQKKIPINN
jgi:hypothetical protein